jgi:pimeloyl-ACP methyl ester carboxylesterase
LWGASDGIVTPAYGRAYCARIPGARFELIEAAGHHPEIEQPGGLVERVRAFVSS